MSRRIHHEGFEKAAAEVAALERALGIHELTQFTPGVPEPNEEKKTGS